MSRPWTSKPRFCGEGAFYIGLSRGTLGVLCALTLASCGQSMPSGYPGSNESPTQSGTLQPLTVPPNQDNRPPVPGTTGSPKTADGLPALHIKGNNTALFSHRLSKEADRLDRLENAVQELRNDFDAMAPAIVRLVSIEGDIQTLIEQLEGLTGDQMPAANAPYVETAPVYQNPNAYQAGQGQNQVLPPISTGQTQTAAAPQNILPNEQDYLPPLQVEQEEESLSIGPNGAVRAIQPPNAQANNTIPPISAPAANVPATAPAPQSQTPPSFAPTMSSNVMDIRIGEHPGKTRIVLDLQGKSSFTADLDNAEKILVIEIPSAGWKAALQKSLSSSPILSSYRVEQLGNGGTMLIVQLKKSASVSYKGSMDDAKTGGQRLIIDLSATR
jgi:hypothetical protein